MQREISSFYLNIQKRVLWPKNVILIYCPNQHFELINVAKLIVPSNINEEKVSFTEWLRFAFFILSTQYNGSTEVNRREHTNRHGCKICQMNQNMKYILSWLFCIPWSLMLVITSWFYIDESCEDQISHSEFNFVPETILFFRGELRLIFLPKWTT